jgi:hypothetical protein
MAQTAHRWKGYFAALIVSYTCISTAQTVSRIVLPGSQDGLTRSVPQMRATVNWSSQNVASATEQFMNMLPQAKSDSGIQHNLWRPKPSTMIATGDRSSLGPSSGAALSQDIPRPTDLAQSQYTVLASNSFPGFSQDDNGNQCGDTASGPYLALAVSAKYVLQLVNDCLSIYDKKGNLQPGYPKNLAAFFGVSVLGGNGRIFYDWVAHRFVIGQLASVGSGNTASGIALIAASASSDPTGAWHIYRIPVGGGGQTPDYLGLGHNRFGDRFAGDIAVFFIFDTAALGNQLLFLPKAKVYAGAGFGYNFLYNMTINGVLVDSLQPVNVASPDDEPRAQFAVHSFEGDNCTSTCNGLAVWAFSNVLQSPNSPGPDFSVSVVPTPSNYASPPFEISQLGGDPLIMLAGSQIRGAVQYAAGSLFAAVNANNGGGSGILAWQLHPYLDDNGDGHCTGAFLNACPRILSATMEQELRYLTDAGPGFTAFNGTIQPDSGRNFTMVFNYMDDFATYPSSAYVSNRVTQSSGSWHDGGFFLPPVGSGAYTYGNPGAWAEWNAMATDNSTHPETIWFSGGYSRTNGTWGTTIGRVAYTASTQP